MKISRRHKIEEMDTIKRHPKRILSVPQPCPDHVGKDIELFCADHNTLCCVMCVATEHRRCEKVASIDKLAKQLEEGAVTEELVDKLESYLEHIKHMKDDRENNLNALSQKKSDIMEQIKNYRENVNILLERLEHAVGESFDRLHTDEIQSIRKEIDWCEATQSAVENAKAVLLVTNRHCSNAQVFITVQQVIERSIIFEEGITKEQQEKFELIDYSFEIDSAFEGFLQSLINVESVGKIHSHHRKAFLPLPPGLSLLRDRNAEKIAEFDAKTPTDTRNCCLSAILFLSDNRLLLADQNNQKIKLFQDDGTLTYEQSFTTWPRDFTEIGDNKIAVTLPKERKIEIFYLGDKLKNLETIRLMDECWGITYSNKHLIVGCIRHDKGCLKFLTLDGAEVDSIEDDSEGRRLFIKTNYVTINANGKEIYITDRTKDTVVALIVKQPAKKKVFGEDQGPRKAILPKQKPRQRSSTALGAGEDQSEFFTDRRARSEIPKAHIMFNDLDKTQEIQDGHHGEKPLSPIIKSIDDAFDERMENSFESQKKDKKNASADDAGSLVTEELEAIAGPVIVRENTQSTIGDPDLYEKAEFDVLYSYSNDILKSAGGVSVDHQGNIYVTGYRSANLHQISPGGYLLKILLQNLSQPLAVNMEPFGDRLAVTETSSVKQNLVQIYRLV